MRLSSATIRNFRCIRDLVIDFDTITTLIGPNDAGKSSVLRAIDWCLNGSAKDLSEEDVSRYAAGDEPVISVELRFIAITDQDREVIGERFLPSGADSLTVRRIWADGGDEFACLVKACEDFEPIRAKKMLDEKKQAYRRLVETPAYRGLPAADTGPKILRAMLDWEQEHPDDLSEIHTDATELVSKGKLRQRFEYVLVGADLRADEQAREAKDSILSRLVDGLDRKPVNERIRGVWYGAWKQSTKLAEQQLRQQMDDLSAGVSAEMAEYRPGHRIRLRANIPPHTPDVKFEMRVFDGTVEVPIDRQGHGFQRTVMLSSLKQLATQPAAGHEDRAVMLALEEPETHQSDIQSRQLAWSLRSAAEAAGSNLTIVFATHNSVFVDPLHIDQVRRISRSHSDTSPASRVRQVTIESIRRRGGEHLPSAQLQGQLNSLLTEQFVAGFVAEGVVLVEGETDKVVLEEAAARKTPLFKFGVAVVNVNGKSNLVAAQVIFDELGIPAMTVFDSDEGNPDRVLAKKGKTAEDAESERKKVIAENRRIQAYHKAEPLRDFPSGRLRGRLYAWDDNLEQVLAEWAPWDAAMDEVCRELGEGKSKRPSNYRQAVRRCEGELCTALTEVVDMARGLTKH